VPLDRGRRDIFHKLESFAGAKVLIRASVPVVRGATRRHSRIDTLADAGRTGSGRHDCLSMLLQGPVFRMESRFSASCLA
jgi:hypothetical protein